MTEDFDKNAFLSSLRPDTFNPQPTIDPETKITFPPSIDLEKFKQWIVSNVTTASSRDEAKRLRDQAIVTVRCSMSEFYDDYDDNRARGTFENHWRSYLEDHQKEEVPVKADQMMRLYDDISKRRVAFLAHQTANEAATSGIASQADEESRAEPTIECDLSKVDPKDALEFLSRIFYLSGYSLKTALSVE